MKKKIIAVFSVFIAIILVLVIIVYNNSYKNDVYVENKTNNKKIKKIDIGKRNNINILKINKALKILCFIVFTVMVGVGLFLEKILPPLASLAALIEP